MGLEEDYATCRAIARENSRSFHTAFSALPAPKRDAVFAVYAWCRRCDDAVDSGGGAPALDDVEAGFESMLAGRGDATDRRVAGRGGNGTDIRPAGIDGFGGARPGDPVLRALADSFDRFGLDPAPFRDMIAGQRMDLDFRQPPDRTALSRYCYLVAGTVGLMILPVLATRNHPSLKGAAMALGEAMQLTNILRDVGEDLAAGRIYLSVEDMAAHGLAGDDLRSIAASPGGPAAHPAFGRFAALWEDVAARAEALYSDFRSALPRFDADSRLAVAGSALAYRAILGAVRAAGHDCLTARRSVADFSGIMEQARQLAGSSVEAS